MPCTLYHYSRPVVGIAQHSPPPRTSQRLVRISLWKFQATTDHWPLRSPSHVSLQQESPDYLCKELVLDYLCSTYIALPHSFSVDLDDRFLDRGTPLRSTISWLVNFLSFLSHITSGITIGLTVRGAQALVRGIPH